MVISELCQAFRKVTFLGTMAFLTIGSASLAFAATVDSCADFGRPTTADAALKFQQCEAARAQVDFIREQSAEFVAKAQRPWLQRFLEDYGIASSAILAGIVGLLSFANTRAAGIRQENQTQLYEALKRFADRDSPSLRVSSAGLLALLASPRRPAWSFLRVPERFRFQPNRRFFLIFDQLRVGMLLEEDPRVITAIEGALASLVRQSAFLSKPERFSLKHALTLAEFSIAADQLRDSIAIAIAASGGDGSPGSDHGVLRAISNRVRVSVNDLRTILDAEPAVVTALIRIYNSLDAGERARRRDNAFASIESYRARLAAVQYLQELAG